MEKVTEGHIVKYTRRIKKVIRKIINVETETDIYKRSYKWSNGGIYNNTHIITQKCRTERCKEKQIEIKTEKHTEDHMKNYNEKYTEEYK